ncbi:hypothetical protein ACTJI8_08375 [Microbacterium sp. 22303]|uniref:hypothetical protein n=1 Tax=Microbacterium sp. 22303 TaxID=3453905 RepID=UPI003F84D23C
MSEPDPHVIAEGLLPTPFTADEIREALRGGATIRILDEEPDGARSERINRFADGDEVGALLTTHPLDDVEAAVSKRVSWRDLQEHAAFPADRTTVVTETIEHPLGQLECLRYDVNDDDGVAVFWFALAHPGMPVLYETTDATGSTRTIVQEIARG